MGPTGPTGQTGSGISGSTEGTFIIPFSSGTTFTLSTNPTDGVSDVAVLAFGSNTSGITGTGTTLTGITLTGYNLPYEAFATPTDLSITNLYGEFTYTGTNVFEAGSYTISATVYTADGGSNTFTPTIATASGNNNSIITNGTVFSFSATFSTPVLVPSMSKIILVLALTGPVDASLTGTASAGIVGYLS